MNDIRWFSPNSFCKLVIPLLVQKGITIATDGDEPARLSLAMSATVSEQAWKFSLKYRCPFVLYIWDLPPWRTNCGRPDIVFSIGNRIINIPEPFRRMPEKHRFYSRLRYFATKASQIWAPSNATKESIERWCKVRPEMIPYCYNSDLFKELTPVAIPHSTPTLLSISRLVKYKNHQACIIAASLISPKPNVRIIGKGDEKEYLLELADKLSVNCSIESGLSDQDLLAAFKAASVIVCPSTFEGFGLTPIEGTACGKPVVVSNISPHRQFADSNAFFFDPTDPVSLVKAIEGALQVSYVKPLESLHSLSIQSAAERFHKQIVSLLQHGK